MNVPLTSPTVRLLELELVRQWLADEHVRLVRQPADAEWIYTKRTRVTGTGFNPMRGEIHLCSNSLVARWLDNATCDLRALNENDWFMNELVFCVHDYFHAWAAQQIAELAPALGFATAPLSADNLEAQAFALLATEAAAIVGVDYWWLSTFELSAALDIGTCVENLGVSYRERDLGEFRQANPEFRVQEPGFFRTLAEFYCHGRFPGFDLDDVRRSPRLLRWLRHELSYGEVQRRYARQWLSHLAGLPLPGDSSGATPIACDAPWQATLLDELGARLWAKVKDGDLCPVDAPIDPELTWRAPERGPVDARFTNLASYDDPDAVIDARGLVRDSLRHWAEQRLRLHRHPDDDPELLAVVPSLLRSVEHDGGKLLRWAVRDRPRFEPERRGEVRDLFFLK